MIKKSYLVLSEDEIDKITMMRFLWNEGNEVKRIRLIFSIDINDPFATCRCVIATTPKFMSNS